MGNSKLARWVAGGLVFLLVNTAYIWAFASPTIFYMANVLLHVGLGLALAAGAVALIRNRWRQAPAGAVGAFAIALALAVFLTIAGATRDHRWALQAHIAAALAGLALLIPFVRRQRPLLRKAFEISLGVLLVFPLSVHLYHRARPDPNDRISNPDAVPASMNQEGGGPKSPFFPSSAETNTGAIIPSNFFMDSETCGECHKDIYQQWKSSMHHFASFNNQFYRKSIEYMQDVVGTQPSKWCAGCHDHAVFFNGRFDRPITRPDRYARSAGRAGLHVVPRHHARRQHHGQRGFHDRVSAAA